MFDLVAQGRSGLKLQIRRGFAHAFLQIGDRGLKIVGLEVGLILGHAALAFFVAGFAAALGGFFHHALQDIADPAGDGGGGDAVFQIVGHLLGAAAFGFLHRALHGAGDAVGIEDDAGLGISGGAANGLHKAGL